MLNNRQPVSTPFGRGELWVPSNLIERGFVDLDAFWEVSKSVMFSATLSDKPL